MNVKEDSGDQLVRLEWVKSEPIKNWDWQRLERVRELIFHTTGETYDIERLRNLPLDEIFAGIFLAVGGALLLTPGFITDFIGFLCLFPSTRKLLTSLVINYFLNSFGFSPQKNKKKADWIEGEFKKEE